MKIYEIPDQTKLPLWAHRVNVREGWQMISDIGHAVGVTWETQNKEYNRWHSNTRKYWVNQDNFDKLIYLFTFSVRYLKDINDKIGFTYFDKYHTNSMFYIRNRLPVDRTEQQHEVLYMLECKRKNMTQEEIDILIEMLHPDDRIKLRTVNNG